MNGEREAEIIATRLGSPPPGYANRTLRLLARRVVELKIVLSISHETVRQTLKKWHERSENSISGDSAEKQRRVRS
ncbi:hypothetical protein QUF90_10240 [Desulfococcaceae bacterium HSG9]|nr:hypothetical protein [Desulfococcaceae bacterium HSG9]